MDARRLIFDIGLHTGRDSNFYLRKGFGSSVSRLAPT